MRTPSEDHAQIEGQSMNDVLELGICTIYETGRGERLDGRGWHSPEHQESSLVKTSEKSSLSCK